MRHLSRLFLILCLLAGLIAAPAASFAAPAGHEQAETMAVDMTMHTHHMMQMNKERPAAPSHHKDSTACAAWCAGVFLSALPRPVVLFAASPSSHSHPAPAEPLAGLAPAPPLQPPKRMLS